MSAPDLNRPAIAVGSVDARIVCRNALGIPNARFWARVHGDWVKLTMRPGDEVWAIEAEPTDEGWRRCSTFYTYDGWCVTRDVAWDERDCDGLHSGGYVDECSIDDLRSAEVAAYAESWLPFPGARLPAWVERRRQRWERDHTAEAAGY